MNDSDLEESKQRAVVQFTHEHSDVSPEQAKEVFDDLKQTNMKHEFWKKFGFQNVNPRTDFRAAGILGLHQFDYFANKYPRVSNSKHTESLFLVGIVPSDNDIKRLFLPSAFLHQTDTCDDRAIPFNVSPRS